MCGAADTSSRFSAGSAGFLRSRPPITTRRLSFASQFRNLQIRQWLGRPRADSKNVNPHFLLGPTRLWPYSLCSLSDRGKVLPIMKPNLLPRLGSLVLLIAIAAIACGDDCCCPAGQACICSRGPCAQATTLFRWCGQPPAASSSPFDEPLVTDRPDFTEAASTVGRGVIQLEMGYTYGEDDDGVSQVKEQVYPQTLLRVGLFADWFEFRLGATRIEETVRTAGVRSVATGPADLYLGIKLALTEQHGILPQMAVIPQMFVPSGSDAFTADEVLPGLNWVYGWDINDRLSLAGSTQANRLVDSSGHAFTVLAQSVSAGLSLTERVGTYGEWFVLAPHSATAADAQTEHYFNGGLTFLLNDNLQLDGLAGLGLNSAAVDFFTGGGIVMRF